MGRREGAAGPSPAGRIVSPHVAGLAPTIGRDTELRDLRAAFQTKPVQVLCGMGGVGKTSLARAYAQRHLADYGLIWWVRAEDRAAVDAEFRDLLEILLPPGEAAQVRNPRALAFAQLARETDPWLLVLDNVPDAEAAQGLLPPAGNGDILITSRATNWPDATRVEPLGTEAAVELLTSKSGDADTLSAKELATELGGLPLALTQAAGFVKATAMDLGTYLRLYRERSADLHEDARPVGYPYTVATTWQLAMDRLTKPAREMLNAFAFCAPEDIPVHTIFSGMDELARRRALGELIAHSLVTPQEFDAVAVHRLVQAVTRAQLGPHAHEWADRARMLIMTAVRGPAYGLLNQQHIKRQAFVVLDHCPPEHPDTMAARSELADAIGRWTLGDPRGALRQLAELLPVQRRVLGDNHPDTLCTWRRLAMWTAWTGDLARAREVAAEVVPLMESVLGAEHVDTLSIRSHVASWIGWEGDVAAARDMLTVLAPIAERTAHPESETIRNNLGYWARLAGQAEEGGPGGDREG